MINEPRRNHWIFILESLYKSMKEVIVFIALIFFKRLNIWFLIGILAFAIIGSILKWRKTIFYMEENTLVFKKGVLSSIKEEIPFNKIATLDMGQNALDRVLKTCTLKVDSGSTEGENGEVKLRLALKDAKEIKEYILSYKEQGAKENVEESSKYTQYTNINDENGCKEEKSKIVKDQSFEDEQFDNNKLEDSIEKKEDSFINGTKEFLNSKKVSIKELTLYSLTKGKIFWAMGIFFFIVNKLGDLEKTFHINIEDKFSKNINMDIFKGKSIGWTISTLLITFILGYLIISIISIIVQNLKYYDFTVRGNDKRINISYGFINKKEYSFPLRKIHAVKIKQSLAQQIFNLYSIEAVTIGYGDESNEVALLYPLANEKTKNDILDIFLPNMSFKGEINKAPKSSIRRFILKKMMICTTLLIPFYFMLKGINMNIRTLVLVMVELYLILLGYLQYKNTSLGVDATSIVASNGGFSKTTTIVKQSSLQSISYKQNPFQKRAGVGNYNIDIYSNIFGEVVTVKHMEKKLLKDLEDNLIV